MLELHEVTLIGIEGVDISRFIPIVEIVREYCCFGAVKILTPFVCSDKDAIPIAPLSYDDYGRFVLKDLHGYIDTDYALLIQHDGFVLNPGAWSNEFFEFDYIGAPLWFKGDDHIVGNGGFSLRSRRFLKATSEMINEPPWTPEDQVVCRTYRAELEQAGLKFAPLEVSEKFAFDGSQRQGAKWNGQFGFHNIHWTDLSNWIPPKLRALDTGNTMKRVFALEYSMTQQRRQCFRAIRQLQRELLELGQTVKDLRQVLKNDLERSGACTRRAPS